MPENTSPEPTGSGGAAESRNESGFSPHSTTASPGSSGRRRPGSAEPDETGEQVNPLKPVLLTVYRLAASISKQHADRTLQIVADLLIGSIETEEFQQRVLDVLRLPFRPLVPSLLEQQLSPIRKEMAARLHHLRQSTNQPSGLFKEVRLLIGIEDDQDSLPSLSYWQVFEPDASSDESVNGRKRRASMAEEGDTSNKKHWRSESSTSSSLWIPPRVYQPPQQQTKTSNASPPYRVQQGDEEWANIHTMLNCILSMVEKTKRALGILQQRANDNQYVYKRSHAISPPHYATPNYEASELRRQAGELIAQTLKATEDRVTQVKRKAEEAVHDVRRAAMAELQRALSAERLRAERLAAEARRQGAEEALLALGRFGGQANKEVCWNCGRRASETCSGCNVARYCSTFCQHKHWEVHHKICGRPLLSSSADLGPSVPANGSLSPSQPEDGASPKPTSPAQS